MFLIPALVALAALALAADRALVPAWLAPLRGWQRLAVVPLALYAAYVVVGIAGPAGLPLRGAARPSRPARRWPSSPRRAGLCDLAAARRVAAPRRPWTPGGGGRPGGHPRRSAASASSSSSRPAAATSNIEASRELGRRLPPGTLVHGKLANGLALENRIRPIFVGRGFGNYDDRLTRDDVRYLLTYVAPRTGYEGPVILDVLEAYPEHRMIRTFDVAETTSGHDRAALIDKGPPAVPAQLPAERQAPCDGLTSRHQGPRRPALPVRVRLRAVRVLPQRQGHRVPRACRRDASTAGCSTPAAAAAACRCRSPRKPRSVVGIDPIDRFRDAGVRLGRREAACATSTFLQADGRRCRSRPAASTWCCRTR